MLGHRHDLTLLGLLFLLLPVCYTNWPALYTTQVARFLAALRFCLLTWHMLLVLVLH